MAVRLHVVNVKATGKVLCARGRNRWDTFTGNGANAGQFLLLLAD